MNSGFSKVFISVIIFFVFHCHLSFGQDGKANQSETKDELFAKYLSDTLHAPAKIKELLSLIQNQNKGNDRRLALEEYEVAFSLVPYVRDSAFILTPLYAQFSGMLDNAGAREMAIQYAKKALEYCLIRDPKQTSFGYNLIGRIAGFYVRARQYDSAMYYYKLSVEAANSSGELAYKSAAQNNIGLLYMKEGRPDSAYNNFERALSILHPLNKKGDSAFRGAILDNIADNYFSSKEYGKSISAYKDKIEWSKLIHSNGGIIVSEIGIAKCLIATHNYSEALKNIKLAEAGTAKEYEKRNKTINMMLFEVKEYYDSASGDLKAALNQKNIITHINDSLNNEQKKSTDGLIRTLTEMEILKAHRDIQYFQMQQEQREARQKEEQHRKEQKAKIIRDILIGGLLLCLAFALVFFMQRVKISEEKKRSEELLLNILPMETALELKLNGSTPAKDYEMVTVLFTDFINFTRASENLKAQELVNHIHYYYSEFDRIIANHSIEKIKTIGDGYMAAGGLPVPNKTNPVDAVRAALEIKAFMEKDKKKRQEEGKEVFELRIGIHTGPVVAGIVGIKKFAYDIWGDTVNIASRIESSGEAGKVNISGSTYELVKEKFTCTYRGKILAKNKGEIDMYFVEG
ncbi:MAG TPA: adenylate/guanylate cyclase domain-containing protein [Bacteroidia bacterium]|nr:adenylate/guanylate cyclase domain-containing protein [Bacteroidia bacterium]